MKKYKLLIFTCLLAHAHWTHSMKRTLDYSRNIGNIFSRNDTDIRKKLNFGQEASEVSKLKYTIFHTDIKNLKHIVSKEKDNLPILTLAAHYALKKKKLAALAIIMDANRQSVDEDYQDCELLFLPYTNKLLGVALIEYCNCRSDDERSQIKQCIELVLSKKPNFNIKIADYYNSSKSTIPIMHYGLSFPNTHDIMRLLIKSGADVNQRNDYDQTPLHYVKYNKTAQLLCDYGANVNARDKSYMTPLITIIKNSCIQDEDNEKADLICTLLEYGAHITQKDICGLTAYDYYVERYQSNFEESDTQDNSSESTSSETQEPPIVSLITKGYESPVYHEHLKKKKKEFLTSTKVPIISMLRNRELGI